ncbi:GLPGLI family protein [Spirosoma sp. KUDC1026]|uniref:GLPGLI family protein n=1 Tax=Spirosoma sp. KUDC1026 TaxID=2745947 RepID=UPI00159BDD00|nr:GLPGLI family protein [Spirosoma sp. KUDC1026]QKZ11289.1 GLPGLI family protein [Spirosoma sp. KUDC1026]
MKTTYLLIALCVSAVNSFAQQTGHFAYRITSKTVTAVSDLFYDGNQSVFVLYDKDVKRPSDTTASVGVDGSNHRMINLNISDGKDFALFKDYRTGAMVSRELIFNGKKCIVNDSIPALDWKLEPEKKMIGQYECQKATTTFRCANYTVWFTTAVPLSLGPWKLGGLPGLIVEAVNENIDLRYQLVAAEYPSAQAAAYTIAKPNTGDPIYSFSSFAEIQQKELKRMQTFLMSMAGNPSQSKFTAKMPECFEQK